MTYDQANERYELRARDGQPVCTAGDMQAITCAAEQQWEDGSDATSYEVYDTLAPGGERLRAKLYRP